MPLSPAPEVRGTIPIHEALDRLLAGTGLQAHIESDSVVISAQAPVAQLSQVTVTGSEQTATGPVYGAVARRTSTGVKTDTDILETPQSVSVVTREQIEAQGATGIDEALRYTSGVVAAAYGQDPRGDWILVRGFAPAKYLDGLPLPDGSWTANTRYEPYALERIEVLKGPSSVMYGALPPSGFINAVSKRPQEDPFHEVGVSYGTHQRKEASFDFTGPVNEEGTLLYRLVGLGRDSKTESDYAFDKRLMLAPSLTWKPSVDTSLTVLASYTYTRARVKETTDPASLNKQVPLQPEHQAALWVDYRFPADIAPGLSMGAGVRYTGASYGDSANQWRASAYTLFDAQAQYNVGNWNLQLTVNNLADKQYIAACNNAMWCYYGYGRAINLSARYSW
ncbi:TonB-dependent receptor [Pusillimonas sp. CC-YST705]|uniref:TonB-dependent receptor n=1 Tax=Mesopusillimonas faecipullorum TaxID=2755040 RepID=A0ABS8C815_9BURK|nr:TonB-dependent receptor [Mesopusillimonas faecipullorum]MCB5362174.1 TonB-dependent receptor [Mesopusillimonas faecipullorum]